MRVQPDTPAGAQRSARPQPATRKQRAAIAAVLMAMAMVVVDGGLSNVALPTIAASLRISSSTSILLVTAYQVAVVMALLPSAALGERFGNRGVFSAGVGIFVAGAAASALSPDLPWLLAARFVQGLGAAAILALGVALLRVSVSDARLAAAVSWNALTVALSAAAGPALGALILSQLNWPWLYAVSIPLGLVVLFLTRALPNTAPNAQPLDILSLALNGAVFGLATVGAGMIAAMPWGAAVLMAGAAAALILLIRREASKARPLIPLDLLRDRSFRVSVIASVFCFTGQTAGLLALPFYLQHGLGQTPAMTGLYLTAWPLSVAASALLTGRLANRMSTTWLCVFGAGLLALGLGMAALWPLDDPRPLIPFMAACGVGFGFFQVANNRNMFLAAPVQRSGAAGGMQGTARLTGQTAGAVLVAQVFSVAVPALAPQTAIGVGAAFVLVAALVSLARRGSS